MSVSMVRCGGCGEVVDGALRVCPRCGAALHAVVIVPEQGSYAERYRDTLYATPPDEIPQEPLPRRRMMQSPLVLIGAALLLIAGSAGGLFVLMNGMGEAPATPGKPAKVAAWTPTPTPAPTLPPTVDVTLAKVGDPNFSAKIVMRTTVEFQDVAGKSQKQSVTMNVQISGGNEVGSRTYLGQTVEFRLVDNLYQVKVKNAWQTLAAIPPYIQLSPLFGLTSTKMLKNLGQEARNGITVNHLQSTNAWPADASRVSSWDTSLAAYPPESKVLDLWVTPDGLPVAAQFTAKTDTADTTRHLVFIQTTYEFSNVDVPVDLTATPTPTASPTPKPSASVKPTPKK